MSTITPDVVFLVAAGFLTLAALFDLLSKVGEIPNKVSIGFTAAILLMALGESLLSSNPSPLWWAAVMGAGFFIVGAIMFYLGEWGGGDVKVLTGIGCSLGFMYALGRFQEFHVFPYYLSYFINFALAASPYVIAYTFILGLLKPEVFKGFVKTVADKRAVLLILFSFLPAALSLQLSMPWMTLPFLAVPILVVLSFYLLAVENIALQKSVKVADIREEDILASDLIVDGKKIAGRREAGGLSEKQLAEIRALAAAGKIPDTLMVRWGIRFVPVFFAAFVLTYFFGDVLELLIQLMMA